MYIPTTVPSNILSFVFHKERSFWRLLIQPLRPLSHYQSIWDGPRALLSYLVKKYRIVTR